MAVHGPHVFVAVLQIGVEPKHSEFEIQVTQVEVEVLQTRGDVHWPVTAVQGPHVLATVLQIGVEPKHSALDRHVTQLDVAILQTREELH
jgi:hypothetical protein